MLLANYQLTKLFCFQESSSDESEVNTSVSTSESDGDEELNNIANANEIHSDCDMVIVFLIVSSIHNRRN